MTPTLVPGDEFVVSDTREPRRGNIVALIHPKRDGFWLVKRLKAVEGDTVVTDKGLRTLEATEAWVVSDNNQATGAQDSRDFGVVDVSTLRPVVTELDEDSFLEGVHLLCEEDHALDRAIQEFGVPEFWRRPPGFETLVLLILEQQVSLESGAAVFLRFRDLVGSITPSTVGSRTPADLREVGLTRQKSEYIVGLAKAIEDGELHLDSLSSLPADEASEKLQTIRGIGRWTAEAYLLSAEGRPDVFPATDRALLVGAGEVLAMSDTPDPEELEILAEPWRPIRAIAARIIWHAYLARRGRVEPDHQT